MSSPGPEENLGNPLCLETEHRQLRTLLRALPDISFVLDDAGRYVQVIGGSNDAMYTDGKGLEGLTLHEALPADMADHFLGLVRETLRTGELQTVEYLLRVADVQALPEAERTSESGQQEQWFEGRILPLPGFDHERPVALWVAVNITPRKNLEAELMRQARTDPLTGLANRQHLLELADQEIARARRHPQPLTLLMMDVDHFKSVNDTLGHGTGDRVLRGVAALCRSQLRETDHFGRVGGEEFVAVLPNTGLEGGITLGHRLVEAAATQSPAWTDSVPVTLSIGAATLTDGEDLDSLMGRADQALYAAKASGRNCLIPIPGEPGASPA